MLKALAKILDARRTPAANPEQAEAAERALKLATAALLFEIVRADGQVRDAELAVMRTAIQSVFDLVPSELAELMHHAAEASRSAVSLYEFTHLVDQGFSAEQKKRIVELLWLVAFADSQKDALEEHLVRRIADLLHVPHPDFIDAKIHARAGRPIQPS